MNVAVIRELGKLKIQIGKETYAPLAFKSFRPSAKNIREAYDAGVRLFDVLSSGVVSGLGIPYSLFGETWIGDYEYDFEPLDRQMELFLENAPDAYFAPMFQLDTREWYLKQHPDSPNSFMELSQIAGDPQYRRAAAAYIKAAVRYCEEKWGDRIYGYFLLCGTTTEWFSDYDFEAPHPFKEEAYRRYCGDASATLPPLDKLNRTGPIFLQEDEADVYHARRFHAGLISDLILYMAGEVQSVIQHKKLLGMYFGYLMELGSRRIHNAGHLDYERVYTSPDIDMLSSPASYFYRLQDDPGAFMLTFATLDAHNKLYFNEFDHRTHTTPTVMKEKPNEAHPNCIYSGSEFPNSDVRCRTEEESVNLMYREFVLAQANRVDLWWFDMLGGWFDSDGMRRTLAETMRIDGYLEKKDRRTAARVAVLVEGDAMYRVRKESPIATCCLDNIRRTLAEMGAPYDLYSACDLSLPQLEDYDFYLFVNQYDIPKERLETIRRLTRRAGKTAMWLYAPGYATDGANSAEELSAVTGIRVTEGACNHGDFIYKDSRREALEAAPYFCVEDTEATALAYHEDGTVAAACKETDGYRSIYCTSYNPPSALMHDLLVQCGVYVYSHHPKVYTYVNNAFIGAYNGTTEEATLQVPQDGAYMDLLTGDVLASAYGCLTLPVRTVRAFMLEKLAD